ncbi:hypothetical protein MVEN_01813500 [Mycena venus]|uniref:Uncharacterized protein n=1 Tax=Mycena venus TaxID=2733690 RepID=A0A8H6XKD3_9AGAR|nr:hypothetical protein MVEN_01813500 [Mycena venus]
MSEDCLTINVLRPSGISHQTKLVVARAARDGGRLDLVVVLMADGERISRRMVAVRSPTSTLYDGLSQIAARISTGADLAVLTPQIREDVSSLLRERKERGDHRPIYPTRNDAGILPRTGGHNDHTNTRTSNDAV